MVKPTLFEKRVFQGSYKLFKTLVRNPLYNKVGEVDLAIPGFASPAEDGVVQVEEAG